MIVLPDQATLVAAVAGPHTRQTVAHAVTPTGQKGLEIPVAEGEVTLDADAGTRRRLRLVTHGTGMAEALAPVGNRIWLRTVYRTTDGGRWLVDLGQFYVASMRLSRPAGIVEVEAFDQALLHQTARLARPLTPKKGETAAQLLDRVIGGFPVTVDPDPALGRAVDGELSWDAGDSVWDVIEGIAESCGLRAWYTRDRILRLRPRITDLDTPVTVHHRLSCGPGGHVASYDIDVSREDAVNEVVVRIDPATSSDKTKTPVMAVAAITTGALRPAAAGRLTHVDTITRKTPVKADATERAGLLLRQRAGLIRTPSLQVVPMAWIEPDDGVEIGFADGSTIRHYVRSVTLPLGVDGGTSTVDCVADNTGDLGVF